MSFRVRDALDGDVAVMTSIYNALLDSTTIEWTDAVHTVDERRAWQQDQMAVGLPVLVAVDDAETPIGWASYGPFRNNERWPGYRFTIEHSVHVDRAWWGRGVGRALVEELLERARSAGMHVMIAAIDAANVESVVFHKRLGFDDAGRLREVGRKHDQWLDLVLMQRTL